MNLLFYNKDQDKVIMNVIILVLNVTIEICRHLLLRFLWQCFITPFGLPEIGFWHSFGICLTFGLLFRFNSTEDEDEIAMLRVEELFSYLIIFALAVICNNFM